MFSQQNQIGGSLYFQSGICRSANVQTLPSACLRDCCAQKRTLSGEVSLQPRQTVLRLISPEEDSEAAVFNKLHAQWITYYLDKTCTLIDTTQREGLIASSLGFLVPRSSSTVSEYFAFHCTHAATFWRAPFGTWAPPYWYSWVSTGEVSDTINVKRSRPAVLTASSHKNRNAFLRRKLQYS